MAKKKKVANTEIDWYLISIDRLKRIGLVILLVILGGGGYWFYARQKDNPRAQASSAIGDAKQALNSLAASAQLPSHRPEFDRAKQKIDEANTFFSAAKFPDARGAAVESQTISRAALSGSERESDAQFLTVEGNVKYQKGGQGEERDAEARTPLYHGDWVKTGDRSSAELIFSNGSLYTVGPNALLEIYSQINPGSTKKSNLVTMQVGTVEVATTDDQSTVRTPGSQVVVDSESTTQVGVDREKSTAVVAMKGNTSVAAAKEGGGTVGPAVKLGVGEKVSATPQGDLSPIKKLSMPPTLAQPADNQVFQLGGDSKVTFNWAPQPGATGYVLQVSRSRLFTGLEINSRRTKPTANARVSADGSFYWRVASVGPDGDLGPFSAFRRFRVSGGSHGTTPGTQVDTTPPPLLLKKPYSIGSEFYIVEGATEPGATVFINDEEVEVEPNGHFKKLVSFNKLGPNQIVVKAVDPAGNPNVQSETVFVEE